MDSDGSKIIPHSLGVSQKTVSNSAMEKHRHCEFRQQYNHRIAPVNVENRSGPHEEQLPSKRNYKSIKEFS